MSATAQVVVDPVWALLHGLAGMQTFDGEFVDDNGHPIEPNADKDGRVLGYAVYYPSPGLVRSLTLDQIPDLIDLPFQVTCAGGDRRRAIWAVDKVRGRLSGAWLTIGGQQVQIREVANSGPVQRDDDPKPPRFHTALIFSVTGA